MVARDIHLESDFVSPSTGAKRSLAVAADNETYLLELSRLYEQLELRNRLLEVVARISTLIARASDFSAALLEGLGIIGEAAHFSRCLLIQRGLTSLSEKVDEYAVVTEWCAPGVRSHHDYGTDTFASQDAAAFVQKLQHGETFFCRIEEVVEPLQSTFERMEIRATGCAPIVVEDELWGALAFDDCVRDNPWDEAHIDALTAVANTISNALQMQHRAEKLATERTEAAQERAAELAKSNAALRRSISRLADVPDVEAAMAEAISAAAEVIGASGGALGLYLPEERGFRTVFQVVDGERIDLAGLSYHSRLFSIDENPIRLAWEQFHSGDGVLWCPPDSCYLSDDSRRLIFQQGFSSSTLVALKRGSECIGYLGFFSYRDQDLLTGQRELLRAIGDQISLMLELSRLARASESAAITREREAAAEERANELAKANNALQATADALSTAQGLENIIPTVLRIVAEVFGTQTAGFYEVVGETIYLRYWFSDKHVFSPTELPQIAGLGGRASATHLAEGFSVPDDYFGKPMLEHRTPVVLNHAVGTCQPEFDKWAKQTGSTLELNIPVVIRNRIVAALCLYRGVDSPYSNAEISLAEALVKQLALALEAERLGVEARESALAREREIAAQERAAELDRANEALRRGIAGLGQLDDLSHFLAEMLKAAVAATGAHAGGVTLLDEQAQTFCVRPVLRSNGEIEPPDSPLTMPFPITSGIRSIFDDIASTSEAWFMLPDDPRLGQPYLQFHAAEGNLSLAHVPLRVGNRLLGALGLGFATHEPKFEKEMSLLRSLADQMAMAVEMVRLSQEAKSAAVAREREIAAEARAIELAATNAKLALRDRLLTASAKALEHLMSANDFSSGVSEALCQIGEAAQLSRVKVLLQVCSHDRHPVHTLIYEWWAEGLASQASLGYDSFPDYSFQDVLDRLHREYRWWGRVEDWPIAIQPVFREIGVASVGIVPIHIEQEYAGLIAFDQCNPDRDWSEAEIDALTIAARGLGAALSQQRMAAQLQKEREQAAQDRASELVKANLALRSSVDDLVTQTTTDGILTSLLKQAIDISGASSGAILRRVAGSEFEYVTIYADGVIRNSQQILAAGTNTEMRLASRLDPTGHFGRLADGEARWRPVDDEMLANHLPRSTSFHKLTGNKRIYDFPYKVAGQVFGYLGLAFAGHEPPSETVQETIKALATQVGLALEFRRISEQVERAAVTEERNKFARDLHDTLAQGFAAILMQLGAAEQTGQLPANLKHYLSRIEDLARSNLAEARKTVTELRTSERVRAPFLSRISELARRLESAYGSVIQVDVTGKQRLLPPVIEDELYLISQESLTNALKHAQAIEITLGICFTHSGIRFQVKDNGRGFTSEERGKPDHFGLQTMQERAQRIQANLTIISEPGFGTEILTLWNDPSLE